MTDEIRQDGKVVLSSEDGFSIPMFFNNLCGKNFSGEKYRDYQVCSPRRDGLQARYYRVLSGRGTAKNGRNPEALNRKPRKFNNEKNRT